jgi:multicomponent Na+:H+ antiporter subunit E
MTFVYTFVILAGFWILLSGKFDAFHLTLGALSCLLVSFVSHDLLFQDKKEKGRLGTAWRFFLYIPWLLYQVFIANLYIAFLALHPGMGRLINPKIIRFRTDLKKDISKVTLANSITLTPGTITVRIKDDEFYVHAISDRAAGDLPGDFRSRMENRIARVFRED